MATQAAQTVTPASQLAPDFDRLLSREWLLTNGRGGFASGTVVGVPTRRYHGLLIAAARPPLERWLMLSNVLEKVTVDGQAIELANFPFDGAIHPRGFEHLVGFDVSNNPQEPWARFDYHTPSFKLEKRITLPRGKDEVQLSYTIQARPGAEIRFELAPFVAMRDFHHLTQAFEGGFVVGPCTHAAIVHAWPGGPRLWLGGRIVDSGEAMRFEAKPDWWRGFFYREEAHRGQDCREDLFVPGWFHTAGAGTLECTFTARALFGPGDGDATMKPEAHVSRQGGGEAGARGSGSSTGSLAGGPEPFKAANALQTSPSASSPQRVGDLARGGSAEVERRLFDAADAFVVTRRRVDGRDSKTILAGYHWFGDWGRDTFIAMPGLLFETRRFDEARAILETFASVQRNGLIPNRFSDYGDGCDYNSVDASLWYLHAATHYLELTSQHAVWRQTLYPACRDIVENFLRGTDFDIHVDADGLVSAGNPATQLTWMDAKFGDTVFTPRHGKAVEINALWYHGLKMLEKLCLADVPQDAVKYAKIAEKVEASFVQTFWNDRGNCLYDVVHADPVASVATPQQDESGGTAPSARGGSRANASIRPNQIFAVSLRHSPLSTAQQQLVIQCVRTHLLTPYGLRSLSPKDPAYKTRCEGSPYERDSAYHQGTVRGWLMGPYVEAHLRISGFAADSKAAMRVLLSGLIEHLDEAGIGSVSEIFDGDPPHTPRGCIAQAWSVAELLRAWRLTALD